ncbi:MAG: NADH-quinone oxidoreductase subunit NuoH [Bacteroidota bacterium]
MQDYISEITGSDLIAFIAGTVPPLAFMVVFTLFAVWLERKVSAHMQDRLGPMRVGYHGALQTLADFLKLLQKEDIVAAAADRPLFNIAPYLVFVGTFLAYAMLPFTSIYIGSSADVGIFFILAVSGFVVAGLLMAGWGSNNKYSLYGAMRSAAQIVSYEIPTALVVLTMLMFYGTMSLGEISLQQTDMMWNWGILGGPLTGIAKFLIIPFIFVAFILLFISSLAETNRTPFDLPESESELVAGFSTEYSGVKFAMFFLAEFANMFLVSAVLVVFFFGGYQSPFGYLGNLFGIEWLVPIEQTFWFIIKGLFFVFVQMWLRWTLPRVRVDQLMTICWKYLIPYAFINLLIVGLILLI